MIGTTNINITIDTGEFYCPHCEERCNYRHRSKWTFLTIYLIPLIPLGSQGQFVQCVKCRSIADVESLAYDPDEEKRMTLDIIRQAFVLMKIQSRQARQSDVEDICEIMFDLFDTPADEAEVVHEFEVGKSKFEAFLRHVHYIAARIPEDGKFLIIDGGVELLSRDGVLDSLEEETLRNMAEAIGVNRIRVDRTIDRAKERLGIISPR